jgi:hypothetical protein
MLRNTQKRVKPEEKDKNIIDIWVNNTQMTSHGLTNNT